MRVIKFRVWDGEKMWYPETLSNDGNKISLHFFSAGIIWGLYDNTLGNRLASGAYEDSVLMQFTGLHDRNGKEIYEGDIVADGKWVREVPFINEIIPMAFEENSLGDFRLGEVIGNIHENSELFYP